MNDKDISLIPAGPYCYDKNGRCPYWDRVEGIQEQWDGYCHFLEKGDLDIAGEITLVNCKTGEKVNGLGFFPGASLLWDQGKECGINTNDWEPDEELDEGSIVLSDAFLDHILKEESGEQP